MSQPVNLYIYGFFLALYALLKHIHAARVSREESFAIACKAMAEKQVIKGWTYLKYQWATELLIEIGLLNRVHVGGRGRGDPHRYVFGGSLR